MNKFSIKISAIFLSILFLLSLVFADTNGIWHYAKDVEPGTFGEDDGATSTYYYFINPVSFTNNVLYQGVELDARYVNEGQVNSISSAMIVDNNISNDDINFNYAASEIKGGSALNSNACNADGICDITTGVVSGEIKVNTIRSNGNGNVVIIVG